MNKDPLSIVRGELREIEREFSHGATANMDYVLQTARAAGAFIDRLPAATRYFVDEIGQEGWLYLDAETSS